MLGLAALCAALFFGLASPPALAAPAAAGAPPARRAVVLYSYHQDFWAVAEQEKGLLRGLDIAGYRVETNLALIRMYLDTKRTNRQPERMEAVATEIVAQIKAVAPDILFVMDDDALMHVGAKFLDTGLPVVFAGVNFDVSRPGYGWIDATRRTALADSLARPGHNVTGVLEKMQFGPAFRLLHTIVPSVRTALFVSDDSAAAMEFLRLADMEKTFADAPFTIVDRVFTGSFETLRREVLARKDTVDAVIMFLPWALADASGDHVRQRDVVAWMVAHVAKPGIAFVDKLAEEGFLCGVVVDVEAQGFHAGTMGGRILAGERPETMPMADPVANRVVLNLARAKQLGIAVPFAVLKGADRVFQTMSACPECGANE